MKIVLSILMLLVAVSSVALTSEEEASAESMDSSQEADFTLT